MNLINYHKMKFLRLAFYVLIAQLVLSGCAGEGVEETSSSSSSEINFDAYVGRNASTRSNITDIDFLKSGIWNAGFGVFARYNYNGKILSLLDTEHVTWNKDQNRWEYTNTRFWPSSGKVDFYAFARYVDIVKMGPLPATLGNSTEETYINFPSNENPIDLIWAKKTGQEAPTSPGSKVTFQFKHALSRLSFKITANQELLEDGAVINVKEVRLYGANENTGIFLMGGYLNLNSESGDWVPYDNNGIKWFYTWTETGKKDGVNDSIQKIDGPVLKLSAPKLDINHTSITNDENSYIFIIPQDLPKNINIMITYTVTQGDFVEEFTIKKNLRDVLLKKDSNFKFEQGKAYVFNLKLLDPINFKVTTDVVPWNEVKDETMPL